MPVLIRRILFVMAALAVIAAIAYAFLPEPIEVDVAAVTEGPMQVTVDEEGKTRIKERYVISAPLGGRLRRITIDPGDVVEAGRTVVAAIEPTDPQLLDPRARAEAHARVRAAEAALQQSGAQLERARSSLDFAEDDLSHARDAYERNAATSRELQEKELASEIATEEYRSAEFAQEIARYELDVAESALMHTQSDTDVDEESFQFQLTAPISGQVLRVFQESVAVVTPGTPLLEVGDPSDLEIVIDVLSTDAVKIAPGAPVHIEHWGGDAGLLAAVRLVEPSAFTKISALGVEEQRVNVIADFVTPKDDRPTLGDGFRVEGRIVLWEAPKAVQVPTSALFRPARNSGDWAVFVVQDDRAALRKVKIGHQNPLMAEILEGIGPGEQVIVHPSDQVEDGLAVAARPDEQRD